MIYRMLFLAALLMLLAVPSSADNKALRDRLKEVKKAWLKAPKAEKLEFLRELSVESEPSVDKFLLETIENEIDVDTASEAARCLTQHRVAKDARTLITLFNRIKDPERRAACLRWLGKYGDAAPVAQLKEIAISEEIAAASAALALIDSGSKDALKNLDVVAQISKNPDARKLAVGGLLRVGDKRGVDGIALLANIEDAAFATHFAIGGALETVAIGELLKFAGKRVNLGVGVRPHLFASLLGRMTKPESHKLVFDSAKEIDKSVDMEIAWWLFGYCKAPTNIDVATPSFDKDEPEDILYGLRYLQRCEKALEGKALKQVADGLAPLLKHADEKVASHALLAATACGVRNEAIDTMIKDWAADEKNAKRRAGALLACANLSARLGTLMEHVVVASKGCEDGTWYVVSAALEFFRAARVATGARAALEVCRREKAGRLMAEAIALLVDLTGQDFGDDLKKWDEWISANAGFTPVAGKLATLRGNRYTRTARQTKATFYGLEIESENIEFTFDRSISMIDPVSREPRRPDFKVRKADVLKRRAEVNRMVRDGFLPRFYVACCEASGALDGMSERAKFGITLFNTEYVMMGDQRMVNDTATRAGAVNWLLSSEVKGGTDIKAALVALCEKGDADTLLVLTDGDPLSLAIVEQIQRANAITRVNIEFVSLHKKEHFRYYMEVLARQNAGRVVDAEPKE